MKWGDSSLRSRPAADLLFKEGRAFRGVHLILIVRQAPEGPRQVLFVASRRVGKAVVRNRAKRRMREAYRGLIDRLSSDRLHLAWIARSSCARARLLEVREEMERLLRSAGVSG
jgi:ribonuclease P protein component